MPVSVLAYVGDAVYELYARLHTCNSCQGKSGQLHQRSVEIVKAKAQAAAIKRLLPHLSQEELAIYKRGRNSQPASRARHAHPADYQMATGLETLIGYISLKQEDERLIELMGLILKEDIYEQEEKRV